MANKKDLTIKDILETKIVSIGVESYDNSHSIRIRTCGDAYLSHETINKVKRHIDDLFRKCLNETIQERKKNASRH
jgi:hypothetical protein